MKHFFKQLTCFLIICVFVISPVLEVKRVEAQAAGGQIAAAILDCTGITGMISGALSSLFNLTEVPTTQSKETCLDSIGYALAKTFLAKMTDSTINWINNGFEGKPSYVGDFKSFFGDEIKSELQLGLDELKRTGTVYFDIIRQEAILSIRQGLRENNLIHTLDADIVKAICTYDNPETETFCSQQLTPESRSELVNSYLEGQNAGLNWNWDVWLSMTQNCGNNPFCALTAARDELNTRSQERITQINTELNRSGGFLGQKECKDKSYQRNLQAWTDEIGSYTSTGNIADIDPSTVIPDRPQCNNWGVTTPGSVIADKIKLSLGTSERQLELADELNESIGAIFDALFNKLISDGLASFNNDNKDGNDEYYNISLEESGFGQESTGSSIIMTEGGCTAIGGIYDTDLEICNLPESGEAPPFPWTMDDGTILEDENDLTNYTIENSGLCVEINDVRVVQGAEPCLVGTAEESGDGLDDGDGSSTSGTATLNPKDAKANTQAQINITGGPVNTDFEIIIDGEFVSGSASDGTGGARESIRLPANYIEDSEILIAFDDGTEIIVSKN